MLLYCTQCSVCYVVICVFFFKQKTAYEMRISDWSSDVCSSDLRGHARSGPAPIPPRTRIAMTIAAKFEIEYLQYLSPDGKLSGKLPPAVKDAKALVPLLKQMLYVRTFDTKAIALQRTGKLGTYAASLGHEATHVGIGASMHPEDVFAPSYREYGAQFMRGVQPREVLMYWGGDERGNDFQGPKNDYPWCVPIATQCLMR